MRSPLGWLPGIGRSFDEDFTHEEIRPDAKCQDHLMLRSVLGLNLNIGKATRGVESLNALPHILALQRDARFLGDQIEQALCTRGREIGKINLLHDQTLVRGHSTGRRRSLRLGWWRTGLG